MFIKYIGKVMQLGMLSLSASGSCYREAPWLEHLAVVQKVAGSTLLGPKDSVHPVANGYLKTSWNLLKAVKGEDWTMPFTCHAEDRMGL